MSVETFKVGSIASWFGSNRMLAKEPGRELANCSWVGVVFAGGMSELPYITARTIAVNDKHHHVINLAKVIGDRKLGPMLYRRLRRTIFHPETLKNAQAQCQLIERALESQSALFPMAKALDDAVAADPNRLLDWAESYFIGAWMSRHGSSGTAGEFKAPLSSRWNANGGDSAAHFWGAVKALVQWRRQVLHRCNFTCLDFREFLGKCKDEEGIGIYCDSPFPQVGDGYKHSFSMKDFRDLARMLGAFKAARVVIRYYDHPLIRELYPMDRWHWRFLKGRDQANADKPEVLIMNGPSLVGAA